MQIRIHSEQDDFGFLEKLDYISSSSISPLSLSISLYLSSLVAAGLVLVLVIVMVPLIVQTWSLSPSALREQVCVCWIIIIFNSFSSTLSACQQATSSSQK